MKMYTYIYKAFASLLVFGMMGVYTTGIAQVTTTTVYESNEKKIVECTQIRTKRDLAIQGLLPTEESKLEAVEREYMPNSEIRQIQTVMKPVEVKSIQQYESEPTETGSSEKVEMLTAPAKSEVINVKKSDVIDDK